MNKTVHVSTADQLLSALLEAEGGEKILLDGGDYGSLNIYSKLGFDGAFGSNVTIASKTSDDPAIFTGMNLVSTGNVTVEDVIFDYTRENGEWSSVRPFELKNTENVTIKNSVFNGDTVPYKEVEGAEEYGWGYGLSVRASSDIVLEGNEFFDWTRALIVDTVENIVVRGNDVHDIRTDGMNFIRVDNVLIEDNHIHDFKAAYNSNDHRDMIQFWTNGATTPSTDITIRNNTLDIGEGSFTQSIFMRNEAVDSQGGGKGMYYQNVLIEGNTIYNGHLHGITVGEANGLTIAENSLVAIVDDTNPDQTSGAVWVPVINVKAVSENVEIVHNATAKINGHEGQADWNVKSNAFIQNSNPYGPGYYDDVFVTSSQTIGADGHAFVIKPGGMLDVLDAGVDGMIVGGGDVQALFQMEDAGGNLRSFDAQLTSEALADIGITNAQYVWDFGDGTTARGLTVEHEFTHAGNHDVTLTVQTPAGVYTADSSVDIRGGQMISFDGSAGAFTAFAYGEENVLAAIDIVQDGAIQLGASGTSASVSQSALKGLRGTDTLDLDFTLSGEGSGEVFRMHGSFVTWVGSKGDVIFQVYSEDGSKSTVRSTGVTVTDGEAHEVSVQLQDQKLTLTINDVVVGTAGFTGTLPTSGSWDLAFGNPWGKPNFEGEISAFDIKAGETLEPLQEQAYQEYTVSAAVEQPVVESIEQPAVVAEAVVEETAVAEAVTSEPVVEEVVAAEPVIAAPVVEEPQAVEPPVIDAALSIGQPTADAQPEFGLAEIQRALEGIQAPDQGVVTGSPATVLRDALNGGWTPGDGSAVTLNGDYVNYGRAQDYEDSQTIGFSVDFTADAENGGESRLVWNHMKLGLTVLDDDIMVQAATKDSGFKAFKTEGLGLTKGETHNATVLLDSENDRLQVLVDDEVVLDVNDVDFEHVDAGGREWGWFVGNPWGRDFVGEVSGFEVSDRFTFTDDWVAPDSNDVGV